MNYDLMRKQQEELSEEHLWDMILSYQNITFKTYSGLPFTYEVRKGRIGKSDLYEYIFQDFVFNSANQLYGAAG